VIGLSRRAATEFSFFLAIPTIFGATVYELWQARSSLSADDLPIISVGFVISFFSALAVVRWLLHYVSKHDFTSFGWYRIFFGGVILLTWATGAVVW
jgi:undecaprenyl-diphosphatase